VAKIATTKKAIVVIIKTKSLVRNIVYIIAKSGGQSPPLFV